MSLLRARSPVVGFSRITLRADSPDSCQIRRLGAPLRASAQKILCTSCSVCLTHRCGRFCGRTRLTRWPHSLQSRKNQTHRKPIYNRRFRAVGKISCAALRNRAAQHIARFARAPQVARDGAGAGANVPHSAKTLVFLSRCSNPNAVFAIPAGTDDIATHSLARRAAWRRSEGRWRRPRKRAQRRPSAGRRSKRAPRISLRFRTTSMTASNGPAQVEER